MRELELEPQFGISVMHLEAKFVKNVPELKAQETLLTKNTCKKHELKVHYRASFLQNFRSLYLKMKELELEPQCGRAVWHNEDKFLKSVPELKAHKNS